MEASTSGKQANGIIYVVGIGPGPAGQMTLHARDVISRCQSVVGYDTYIDLIAPLLKTDQEVVRAGMTEEVFRAQKAVELAGQGKVVAVISSGDPGLYGMAGLVFEVLHKLKAQEKNPAPDVDVVVVPGITALSSAASLLGAPIMHDFCAISLSDHLTPWQNIEERLQFAAQADFVTALYNPKSSRRKEQIEQARRIFLNFRAPQNAVGMVTSAYRERQQVIITDLEHMLEFPIGMLTTVIIGNSTTQVENGKMITPRGYHRKYQLDSSSQKIKKTERLQDQHEPWSLGNTAKNGKPAPFPLHNAELVTVDDSGASPYILKTCDFCDGEKTESVPWLDKVKNILESTALPGELKIGFNGCGRACHGAAMEDIGIIYFRGDFEVHIGAKKTGRNVRLPLRVYNGLSGDEMIGIFREVVEKYQAEGLDGEKFFKYVLRLKESVR